MSSPALRSRNRPLGKYLEWNKGTIRVVLHVPKPLQGIIGTTKVKKSLHTDSPKTAEAMKWRVIAELRQRLADARKGRPAVDPIIQEAAQWRESLTSADTDFEIGEDGRTLVTPESHRDILASLMAERAGEIERAHGYQTAKTFADVAQGVATPLELHVDDWLSEGRYATKTKTASKAAVRRFISWHASTHPNAPAITVEAVTRKVAADYRASFIETGIHHKTANSNLSFLSSYWTWLAAGRGPLSGDALNPWRQVKRIEADRHAPKPEDGQGGKRPFTTEEVATLLKGVWQQVPDGAGAAIPDMCPVAALTGARIAEIASLRVRHVNLDRMEVYIPGEKTENAGRLIPLHSGLKIVMQVRMRNKKPDDYIFHEIPDQKEGSGRNRGAPITQAFTRIRRKLGVDDVLPGARQSRIDFHSWRRWFMREAGEAFRRGESGFDPWTIADVVGHSKDDMPLPMTMGVYPGRASMGAMRACVEAVKLPSVSNPATAPDILAQKSEAPSH